MRRSRRAHLRFGPIVAALFALVVAAEPRALAQSSITYIYDENGRLAAVIDPSADPASNVAVYHYDLAGNITSIERRGASVTTVLGFSPPCGAIGTAATIYGTGFSTTAAQNTVVFTGATGVTPTAASATQLTVLVPAGATTGPISVTAPGGTGASPSSFRVDACGAPTITDFTTCPGQSCPTARIAVPGTAFTITGTNFQSTPIDNRVAIADRPATVTSSNTTTIAATVPVAGAGRVSVTTAFGQAVSGDFFIVPAGYTAAQVDNTYRVPLPGTQTVTIATPANPTHIALLVFDGAAGHVVSIKKTSETISGGTVIKVYAADATEKDPSYTGPSNFVDAVPMPRTGTYTALVRPTLNNKSGSVTLTFYDAVHILTSTTLGAAPISLNLAIPGQNADVRFAGTAAHRVSALAQNMTGSLTLHLFTPAGVELANVIDATPIFLEPQLLATTGTYTVRVNPWADATGQPTLALYDVPADPMYSIVPSGSAVTATTTTPGQNAVLTFNGTANQRVSILESNDQLPSFNYLSLYAPDGTTLFSANANTFIGPTTLPQTGTYSLVLDPYKHNVGSLTFNLYDVPPDPTYSIQANGPAVTVTTTAPGQNVTLTFTGNAGERRSILMTNDSYGSGAHFVSVKAPDGSTVVSGTLSLWIEPFTLPTTGTYTILLDPANEKTGSRTFNLYSVPADVTGSLVINNPAVTVTLSSPGQNASYTFSGTNGQVVTVRLTSNTIGPTSPCVKVSLIRPNGTTATWSQSCASSFNLTSQTLNATGTHTVTVDPTTANTGSIQLRVTNP